MREIPFFNYPSIFHENAEEFVEVFKDVCNRGAFILQKDIVEFEQELCTFSQVEHAITCANATDALVLLLLASGIGSSDEVIFSSHTFVATAAAIKQVGAIPIPVECGSDRLISPDSVKAHITSRTRAILPTHLNGRICDMEQLKKIASKHNLLIIEDAAQALGAKYNSAPAGSFGQGGCISFYPAKSLGAFGDGGAILTNDSAIASKIKLMRNHGRDDSGAVRMWGLNSRLDNLQAAILRVKLRSFPGIIGQRRKLAQKYSEELESIKQLSLPPGPGSDSIHFDTFQNYEIEADDRDRLKEELNQAGIGTIIQWSGAAVHQFRALGLNQRLPFTERFFERCLLLPLNNSISEDDVVYVCDTIRRFYG